MKRIMLTTATCDNRYVDVLKVFLMSMKRNAGEQTLIRADLVNGNDDIYARLKRIYENLEINHIDLPKTNWEKEKDRLLPVMYLRLPRMMATMNENWDQIMSIDCDAIVRKALDNIWDGVIPSSYKVWVRKEKKPCRRFQAGVQIFGNSPVVREYYKDFMAFLGDNWSFYAGQQAIYTMYLNYQDKIKLIPMEEKYNDCKFRQESFIWHSKHSHIDEKPFRRELNYYLAEANKLYGGIA